MKNKIFNKLFICACMILLCNPAAFCCWVEMTPVVLTGSSSSGNDGYINWNYSGDDYNGLFSAASAYPTTQGTTSQSYESFAHGTYSSRKIGFEWPYDTSAEAATFLLSWAGYTISDCVAVAETIGDYSKAQEYGRVEVSSADFHDNNHKWMVLSSKGAHCPANPPFFLEGEKSDSETIEIEPGLPASADGIMTWSSFYMSRFTTREVTGLEASDTTEVNTNYIIYNHIGLEDPYNKQVDAIAYHMSYVDLSFQCGNNSGYGIDGHVMNLSRSVTFDMEQL